MLRENAIKTVGARLVGANGKVIEAIFQDLKKSLWHPMERGIT